MNVGACVVCQAQLPDTDIWIPYSGDQCGFTDVKTWCCDKCGNETAVATDTDLTKERFAKLVKALK